ncbi:MAG TPA: AAA family ATPase [Polyangiaceae bacterium]|nr:AAA family ATPase [Polyangiaceae bacterium]
MSDVRTHNGAAYGPHRGQAQPGHGQAYPPHGQAQPGYGQAQPPHGQAHPQPSHHHPQAAPHAPAGRGPGEAAVLAHAYGVVRSMGDALMGALGQVILGQDEVLRCVVIALLADGHVLLEGAPGVGKTQIARTVATLVGGRFARVQCTPDLMPSDVVGTSLVVDGAGGGKELSYRPGPIFANFVLADEINRATPKTQSAMLEAMAERTVTVEGQPRPLPSPFFVMATENPIESEGVFPLPEAQLDRFLMKLLVPMPDLETLARIGARGEAPAASPIATPEDLLRAQAVARTVPAAPHVERYAARLVVETHKAPGARYGAGPRAVQALMAASRVRALLAGRAAVAADDVRALAPHVLRHRIGLRFEAEAQGLDAEGLVRKLLETVPVES